MHGIENASEQRDRTYNCGVVKTYKKVNYPIHRLYNSHKNN